MDWVGASILCLLLATFQDTVATGRGRVKRFGIAYCNKYADCPKSSSISCLCCKSRDFMRRCESQCRCYCKKRSRCTPTTNSCYCGLLGKPFGTRSFGGSQVQKNRYPWMARLNWKHVFSCGGSLINSRWILTAAHCVSVCSSGGNCVDDQISDIKVFLGDHNKDKREFEEIEMDISEIIKHPNYYGDEHDIALLKLSKDIDFTKYAHHHIRPICLPGDNTQTYLGWEATVAGWGDFDDQGNNPSILQEVNGIVLPSYFCGHHYGDETLCVKHSIGQKICDGDSGGPLITKPTNHDGVTPGQNYELIGVASFSFGDCKDDGDYDAGYARVTEHLNWIKKIVSTTAHNTCPRA